ncbi:MAG: carboxylate--amine ligase, partial [Deltaproteobacteria bacterium]|nr:carboxylate--amine ligase [Deltaproteobacteria bacterium]
MKIIEDLLKKDTDTLSEHESKLILAEYGVPITREYVVGSEKEAVSAAAEIGFPVVLKGSGKGLRHKTELNLISLGMRDEKSVREAYRKLISHQGQEVREVLVQQMIGGERELLVGFTRDRQFGPCVMFGLGGIYTEILKDFTFRIAPLSRRDALDMMEDIRGREILNAFRGKQPV